jgi:acetone carboxylase gamma subunit
MRFEETDLRCSDYVQIVEDTNERVHKANCERAFTLAHRHYNCVVTIVMTDKMTDEEKQAGKLKSSVALTLSNLESF